MDEIAFDTGSKGAKVSIVETTKDRWSVRIEGGHGMTHFGEQDKFDAERSARLLATIVYKR